MPRNVKAASSKIMATPLWHALPLSPSPSPPLPLPLSLPLSPLLRTTTDTGLVWCPWCGNRSLYRVAVVVDSTGKMSYRPLSNKQFSHKGLRVSQSAYDSTVINILIFLCSVSSSRPQEWPPHPQSSPGSRPAGHIPRPQET